MSVGCKCVSLYLTVIRKVAVFILTLRNTESGEAKLVKNFGVFQKRSDAHVFLGTLIKKDPKFSGGTFKITLNQLKYYENELGYNPELVLLYQTNFWAMYVERSTLY